jgi:UDP-N-acetylmuramoyl-L-alanyl-D-glutamate--2,6-diaminopimelate ligase
LGQIPGRFQSVPNELGFSVVVDYAHTSDGLQQVIESARAVCANKLIVVFGCGGDRDAGKRPLMGAAAQGADIVIVTSDNPRSEDPAVNHGADCSRHFS